MKNKLYNQDCLKGLSKLFPDNYFTGAVTDPNYGIKFMNKEWDYDVPSVEIWRECLRVLKPGAYALVFGGTRTFHRLVCNIEDAGFIIRDTIVWHYGSGFPKSHNVSKAIDKMKGAKRKVIGHKGGRYNSPGTDIRGGKLIGSTPGKMNNLGDITTPATEDAKTWEGWGTALKPASELICVCQKPISEKTIVKNILKWGTGALNIDGCRIPAKQGEYDIRHYTKEDCFQNKEPKKSKFQIKPQPEGRYPANVIFDEKSAEMLDKQSGILESGKPIGIKHGKSNRKYKKQEFQNSKNNIAVTGFGDSGFASRFFYCAKASPSERAGAKHPTIKPIKLIEYLVKLLILPECNLMLDPFMGSGTTAIACENLGINWIGFEKEKDYCEPARNRIQYYRRKRKLKK